MSTVNEVRELLAQSEAPLSPSEIIERMGHGGGTKEERKAVYQAISNGVVKGHLIRHHSPAGLTYSVNREYAPKRPGPKPKAAKKPPPPGKAPPASVAFAVLSDAGRATDAEIDAFNARPPAVAAKPSDFDLHRRLDAIGSDLADAIADACDAEHPHALIKALVVSREAVSRAQAALPR